MNSIVLTEIVTKHIPKQLFHLPLTRTDFTLNNKLNPDSEIYLVFNLSDNYHHGDHWIAACNKPDDPTTNYFDSYGLPPPQDVLNYLLSSGKPIAYSYQQYQHFNTTDCGPWVIAFLINRYRYPLKRTLEYLAPYSSPESEYENGFLTG